MSPAQEIISRVARAAHDYQMLYQKQPQFVVIHVDDFNCLRQMPGSIYDTREAFYQHRIQGLLVCHPIDEFGHFHPRVC